MNEDYLLAIWNNFDEIYIQDCLEEIYKKKGYKVKNYHKHDKVNEKGTDLVCTKGDISIGIAVKKKPLKKDINQLKELAKNPIRNRIYVFVAPPTRPFEEEMKIHKNIEFWNWKKLHEELITNESKKYILAYFSIHPLVCSLYNIYKILYDCQDINFNKHKPNHDEIEILWNIKDDAVKLKSNLDYVKDRWNKILMNKTEFDTSEYIKLLEELHEELSNINSKFGDLLNVQFQNMKLRHPDLLRHLWDLASQRTNWKKYTSMSRLIGKTSRKEVDNYTLFRWILPDSENGKYSYVMRRYYSTL